MVYLFPNLPTDRVIVELSPPTKCNAQHSNFI